MDIRGRRQSKNIEDRRGMRVARPALGIGVGGLLLMLVLSLFGINPLPFLTGMQQVQQQQGPQMERSAEPYQEGTQEGEMRELTAVVLSETEQTWSKLFQESGSQYQEPALVLFNEAVQSECGAASAASGPFYCPLDRMVYLDMSFYNELEQRFGAEGDFAKGYVIAHEVGHHVQNLVGTAEQVYRARERLGEREANDLSVRMELQADCFAGVWAKDADATRHFLSPGDIEEGLVAASAIGDDRIQQRTQGRVNSDLFTHGTSAQRQRWFMRGYEAGRPESCDSFSANPL